MMIYRHLDRLCKVFQQLTGCRMFPPVSWHPMHAFWNSAAPRDCANAVQILGRKDECSSTSSDQLGSSLCFVAMFLNFYTVFLLRNHEIHVSSMASSRVKTHASCGHTRSEFTTKPSLLTIKGLAKPGGVAAGKSGHAVAPRRSVAAKSGAAAHCLTATAREADACFRLQRQAALL
jgi:hypothetical protein